MRLEMGLFAVRGSRLVTIQILRSVEPNVERRERASCQSNVLSVSNAHTTGMDTAFGVLYETKLTVKDVIFRSTPRFGWRAGR